MPLKPQKLSPSHQNQEETAFTANSSATPWPFDLTSYLDAAVFSCLTLPSIARPGGEVTVPHFYLSTQHPCQPSDTRIEHDRNNLR